MFLPIPALNRENAFVVFLFFSHCEEMQYHFAVPVQNCKKWFPLVSAQAPVPRCPVVTLTGLYINEQTFVLYLNAETTHRS